MSSIVILDNSPGAYRSHPGTFDSITNWIQGVRPFLGRFLSFKIVTTSFRAEISSGYQFCPRCWWFWWKTTKGVNYGLCFYRFYWHFDTLIGQISHTRGRDEVKRGQMSYFCDRASIVTQLHNVNHPWLLLRLYLKNFLVGMCVLCPLLQTMQYPSSPGSATPVTQHFLTCCLCWMHWGRNTRTPWTASCSAASCRWSMWLRCSAQRLLLSQVYCRRALRP